MHPHHSWSVTSLLLSVLLRAATVRAPIPQACCPSSQAGWVCKIQAFWLLVDRPKYHSWAVTGRYTKRAVWRVGSYVCASTGIWSAEQRHQQSDRYIRLPGLFARGNHETSRLRGMLSVGNRTGELGCTVGWKRDENRAKGNRRWSNWRVCLGCVRSFALEMSCVIFGDCTSTMTMRLDAQWSRMVSLQNSQCRILHYGGFTLTMRNFTFAPKSDICFKKTSTCRDKMSRCTLVFDNT